MVRKSLLRRAQISMEYLVIVGVSLGVLIPGVLFFYVYSQSNALNSASNRLNDIGLQSMATVKSTYALGNQAWQTMEFVFPDGVSRAYVNQSELVFVYDTPAGPSEAVFFSAIPLVSANVKPDGLYDLSANGIYTGTGRYRFTSVVINGQSSVNITEAPS